MKKIVAGKKYDTETAKALGEYWNGLSFTDFGYVKETLYLKKTGEFFLHGEGGALSKYSRNVGNGSYSSGERIIPLSKTEAREWAEEHIECDEYERIFGEMEE